MSLKTVSLRGIGPRFIISVTLLLMVSLVSVASTIYYLLSTSLRESDHHLLRGLQETYQKIYDGDGPRVLETRISPDLMVQVIDESGKILFSKMPSYIDHDFEDEDEIRQLEVAAKNLELKSGWKTILLLSGEEDQDQFQKLEYRLRQYVWKKNWESVLPFIDNDMIEVYTVQMKDGLWMRVGRSSEEREEHLSHIRYLSLIVITPFLLVGVVLSFLLSRTVLSPLRALAQTMERITKGETGLRAQIRETGDEIDLLSGKFNELLNKNDQLIENTRQTVDTVAHELRTPVARFRASAETALLDHRDLSLMQEALEDALEGSDKMLNLLNGIMEVSLAEASSLHLDLRPVNLSSMLADLGEFYEILAQEKNIQIDIQASPDIFLMCDEPRLQQAFSNLLENALKYSSENSMIEIFTETNSDSVIVHFKDAGVGIAASDLPKIWDRLYRADKSRSSQGLGIGLSLVKALVELHGGQVRVQSQVGVGSDFQVTLPVCNKPESLL